MELLGDKILKASGYDVINFGDPSGKTDVSDLKRFCIGNDCAVAVVNIESDFAMRSVLDLQASEAGVKTIALVDGNFEDYIHELEIRRIPYVRYGFGQETHSLDEIYASVVEKIKEIQIRK